MDSTTAFSVRSFSMGALIRTAESGKFLVWLPIMGTSLADKHLSWLLLGRRASVTWVLRPRPPRAPCVTREWSSSAGLCAPPPPRLLGSCGAPVPWCWLETSEGQCHSPSCLCVWGLVALGAQRELGTMPLLELGGWGHPR